ncbi:TonB-dependent receptor [Elusimicrobiota bacterium]
MKKSIQVTMIFTFLLFSCATMLRAQKKEGSSVMKSATPLQGQRGVPANLPDISMIGNIMGTFSDDKNDSQRGKLLVDEIELALQGYIYPKIRADVFPAWHRHDDTVEAEICEAKATFLNLPGGLGAEIGKVHVGFGKINKIHTHRRLMADQPQVITNFLGEHGLVGEGASLNYLAPLPFFAQIEAGAWTVPDAHSHTEDEHSSDFSLANKVYTGRAWTSFAATGKSELEISGNFAKGSGSHFDDHLDKTRAWGSDLTFKFWPSAYGRLIVRNEWIYLERRVPVGKLRRHGFYSFANYRFDKYWDIGARYDYADNALPARVTDRSASAAIAYHFTETTLARAQYKRKFLNPSDTHEAYLHFIFGIGPHSHQLE